MANIVIPQYNYTYDGKLALDFLINPGLQNPDVQSLFTTIPNVKYKLQLNLVQQLGKMVKGAQGCNQVQTGAPALITNRTLETCKQEFYWTQCEDVFESTVLVELTNSGIENYNLTGNRLGGLINNLITQNLQREMFRILSFGDTTAGNDFYNMCDGLWPTLLGADDYDVTVVDSGISSLAATDIKNNFKDLYTGADILLKQIPTNQKGFYVTLNVYESLMEYYENNSNAGGFVAREENGVMTLRYRGIKVIPLSAWDEWIETDNLGNNVRILYTTPQNHMVGLDSASNQGTWRFWYDPNTRLNKVDGSYRMGYNYIHDKLQAISYGNVV